MRKDKENHASFAVKPQNAKVSTIVLGKCLVKMKEALHLWVEDMTSSCSIGLYERSIVAYTTSQCLRERPHSHIFYSVFCYNCSILLVVIIVNLLLSLSYKLNFIIEMYAEEKHSMYRVRSYLWFQASTGSPGHCLWIRRIAVKCEVITE